jgi:hypothetical protein
MVFSTRRRRLAIQTIAGRDSSFKRRVARNETNGRIHDCPASFERSRVKEKPSPEMS